MLLCVAPCRQINRWGQGSTGATQLPAQDAGCQQAPGPACALSKLAASRPSSDGTTPCEALHVCSAVQLVTHEKTSNRPIMVIRMYCSREKCSLRDVESCARHSAIRAARKAAPNLTKASTCTLLSAISCRQHMGLCTGCGLFNAFVSSVLARWLAVAFCLPICYQAHCWLAAGVQLHQGPLTALRAGCADPDRPH